MEGRNAMRENGWISLPQSLQSPGQCSRARPVLLWLEYGCWIAGILSVGMFVVSWLGILTFQASQAKRLEAVRETRLQTPGTIPLRPGDPFGKVAIPRIGLSAMVAEGDDSQTLAHAVGHIPWTAAPESTGNVGLAGHRNTFFRGLGRVRLKDLIELETAQGKYEYEVVRMSVVDPGQVEVLDSSNKSELTLVTCYPFHYIGAAPQRFIVQSIRVAPH
jgi:sortase A